MKILLIIFSLIAIFAVIILSVFFYGITQNPKFEDIIKIWADFGDFMGGTLNPILSALSLFGLLFTIYYQNKELEETRKELKESRIAQQEQSESLKLQNEATKLQMFESTFFKLFELHNDKYEKLKNRLDWFNNHVLADNESSDGKIYILNKFTMYRTDQLYTYLLTLFGLLIFIDKEDSKNTNLYIGLVKASINNGYILTYIALECMSNDNLKILIEKYSLLESLNLVGRNRKTEICLILNDFDKNAFGLNEDLLEMLSFSKDF